MENKVEISKKAISSKQLVALVFVIGLGMNVLNLPALSVMEGGRDGWLVMLAVAVFDCVALYCTLYVMEKLESVKFGKALSKTFSVIIGVAGFLWTLSKLSLIMGELRLFYGGTVFENIDWFLFLVVLGLLIAVMGAGGGRGLGRICELVLPLAIGSVAILLVTSFVGDIDFTNIFPSLYKNIDAVKSPVKFALWAGNYPVLLCFFKDVELKKHTKLFATGASAISGIAATVMSLPMSATYGAITHLISYGSNVSDMNQYVGSYNFGRIDLIIFTVWSVVLLIEAGVFQYACVRSISPTVGKSVPWLYSGIAFLSVYILLNTGMSCKFKLFEFATHYASVPAFILQLAVPIAAAIVVGIIVKFKNRSICAEAENEARSE